MITNDANRSNSSNEDDTDSLDIKPPQAHKRDVAGVRHSEKSAKNRKHSKDRKHRHEDHAGSAGGGVMLLGRNRDQQIDRRALSPGAERERRRGGSNSIEYRRGADHRRGHEIDHYYHHQQQQRGGGGAATIGFEGSRELDRRYSKYYERTAIPGNNHHNKYHYHEQASVASAPPHHQSYHHHMHLQQRQSEYYEQQRSARHHSHSQHQQPPPLYGKHADSDLAMDANYRVNDEMLRDRRAAKKHQERPKDAESLEQDLRSRLLIKRHKYVKNVGDEDDDCGDDLESDDVGDAELEDEYELQLEAARIDYERSKVRASARNRQMEKHIGKAHRRVKQSTDIIELLDTPKEATGELGEAMDIDEEPISNHRPHKHKRHHHHKQKATNPIRDILADDDEDGHGLLRVERAKERRMEEIPREHLDSRRGKLQRHRSSNEYAAVAIASNKALSPSAVAKSVTAGLRVIKRRSAHTDGEEVRSKHRKRSSTAKYGNSDNVEPSESETDEGELDDDDDEDDDDDDDDEANKDGSSSESDSESVGSERYEREHAVRGIKAKGKSKKKHDELETLPDSPLSFSELSKSPLVQHRKATGKRSRANDKLLRDGQPGAVMDNGQVGSERSSHSGSRSPASRSRSDTGSSSSAYSGAIHSRSRSRSRSPSGSRSGSRSPSASSHGSSSTSRSNSPAGRNQRSRSHSKSGLPELPKTPVKVASVDSVDAKQQQAVVEEEPIACDEMGVSLPDYWPGVQGCRSVEEFQHLNRIEEGTYGVVYRAKDKRTNEIVALKRLKMEKEKEGFPITSLREINTLLKGQHPNIVTVREIVVGSNNDKIFIVMDYVEHDLKSLMETMKARKQSFLAAEVKCLVQQLLRAVGHLHDNWILHRDLKTSNLLLSHKGILKVGDFGLAREYGSPLKKYTSLVVTLWYRAPELLLCSPEYSTPVDLWSCGCIFAEFQQMAPLFPGKSEIDELNRIFKELGTPTEKIWPGYKDLPAVKSMQFTEYPVSNLRKRLGDKVSENGISLLQGLLTYDPKKRLSAEAALKHEYFSELPLPIDPSMFPTWPAKSELGARKALAACSPKPPSGGSQFKQLGRDDLVTSSMAAGSGGGKVLSGIITGNKKTAANTGFVLNANVDQRQLAMAPGFSLKF